MQRIFVFLLATVSFAVAAQGVTPTEIVIGQTAGFTGPVSVQVKEMTAGALLYLDHINANGGINKRKIRLESMDDAFLPPKAGENAKVLIEQKKVFALFLVRGTPHTEAALPHARKAGVPVIAPSTGAGILHDPVDPLIFNVRSKYQDEAEKAIMQLATQGIKRIVVIHVDDSFGKDGLIGYQKGFKATGLPAAGVFSFDRTTGDSTDAVAKTLALSPEAVVTAGSGKHVVAILRALRAGKSTAVFMTLSNNSSQGFIKDLGEDGNGTIVMQVFPDPRRTSLAINTEMQRLAADKKEFVVSHLAMEGFAAAKVLVEGLRRAGKNPTRASFITALETIKDFDLGGLSLSYSRSDHTGMSFVEASVINKRGTFTQ
ncbi:MAG: ABC transporter substrate-binding protein [Betaproteobacteria bacterium]